jgi:chemotaxis methyl-accepting protein methylase
MFFSFFRHKHDEDDDEDDFYGRPDDDQEEASRAGASKEAPLPPPIGSGVGRLDRQKRMASRQQGRPGASSTAGSSAAELRRRYEEYERNRSAAAAKASQASGGTSGPAAGSSSGSSASATLHYAATHRPAPKSPATARDMASIEKRMSTIGRPTAAVSASVGRGFISRNPDVVPATNRAKAAPGGGSVSDMQYHRFAAYLQEKSGIVLGENKQYLVNSRLSSLLNTFRATSIDDLLTRCMDGKDDKVAEAVLNAMTTNETLWFRDTYPYLALSNIILPELAMRGKFPVRIWSSACSSGQEPYSIAITVLEMMSHMVHIDPSQVQIIATDLSTDMLQRCRAGYYDAHALSRGLSAERRAKFFRPTHNPALMQIDPRVKHMVEFRQMNLLGSYALMGRFDVIFCRNVLIYFNNDVKAQILRKFSMCLNKGGYLILGSTETLVGVADQFEMMRCHPGIIYKKIR